MYLTLMCCTLMIDLPDSRRIMDKKPFHNRCFGFFDSQSYLRSIFDSIKPALIETATGNNMIPFIMTTKALIVPTIINVGENTTIAMAMTRMIRHL